MQHNTLKPSTPQKSARGAKRIDIMELFGIFGFASFFAWFLLTSFGSCFAYPPEISGQDGALLLLPLFLGMFLCSLVMARYYHLFEKYAYNAISLIVLLVLGCLLPLLTLLNLNGVWPYSLLAFGIVSFATGFVSLCLFIIWEDVCGRSCTSGIIRFVGPSLVGGSALFLFVMIAVPPTARPLYNIAFLALSAAILYVMGDKLFMVEHSEGDAKDDAFFLNKRVSALFFIFSIAFGIAWVQLIGIEPLYTYCALGAGILIDLIVIGIFRLRRRIEDKGVVVLLRVCIVVIAIAFILLSTAVQPIRYASLSIIIALWLVYWTIDTGLLLQHALDFNLIIPHHSALGKIASTGGFFVGWFFGTFFPLLQGTQGIASSTPLIIVAVIIFFSMLLLPVNYETLEPQDVGEKDTEPTADECRPKPLVVPEEKSGFVDQNQVTADQLIATRCNELADLYLLSPREGEILQYLAKGRNAKFIADQIFISEHTTKTHIYHIYKKMDVHSQQKLIDIIEHRDEA